MFCRFCLCLNLSFAILLVGTSAFAQGRGHGLNRALGAATRGSSNSGLGRAGQSAARSGGGFSDRSANLGRSANGLNRAATGMSHSAAATSQNSQADRILDKRLQQADHLQQISAKNGNARLLDTSERMQQSAQTNYERSTNTSRPAPAESPRSSWLPAWLRTSR